MARRKSRKNNDNRIGPARVVGLAFVVMVALAVGLALFRIFSPEGLHLGARTAGNRAVEGVLVHIDDRTLTLSFPGNNPVREVGSRCWEGYDVVTTEDAATVRVEVRRLEHVIAAGGETYICEGGRHRVFETVELAQLLGGRTIVNDPNGVPISPLPAASLLTLDGIPEGWSLAGSAGTTDRWTRTWTNGPYVPGPVCQQFPEVIQVSQENVNTPPGAAPSAPVPFPVTVRGNPATFAGDPLHPLNRTLRWDERGTTVLVRATHAAPKSCHPPSFTDKELLAVAERLA